LLGAAIVAADFELPIVVSCKRLGKAERARTLLGIVSWPFDVDLPSDP